MTERAGLVDRWAEWLIRRCPFTTLTLLSLVVIASAVTFDRPWIIVATAVACDLMLNLARRARRHQSAESSRLRSHVAA